MGGRRAASWTSVRSTQRELGAGQRSPRLLGALLLGGEAAQVQTAVAGTLPGQFGVSESGAATYRISIEVPPWGSQECSPS